MGAFSGEADYEITNFAFLQVMNGYTGDRDRTRGQIDVMKEMGEEVDHAWHK